MSKAAVIGAGSWGTTVASLLADRLETVIWSRSSEIATEIVEHSTNRAYLGEHVLSRQLRADTSLEQVLDGADLVITAVPSHGLRDTIAGSQPQAGAVVLSVAKGLEQGTHLRMSEVIAECWPDHPIGVLTGPNLAPEVLDGQPTASVIAFNDEDIARELQALFGSESLRIYTNRDVVGCEVAGVVKNVMAIASGMAVGLGFGDNTRAALITRALAELSRLGIALGGEQLTFAGLAGVGDLVATCTSSKSRNYLVGVALGRGKTLAEATGNTRMVAEGVRSSGPVVELAELVGVEVPVAEQVYAVCHLGRSPKETIPSLMRRASKSEFDGFLTTPN
jgi:glycerol-3-phosphate dehydrogenase (NAD(P)+)